MATAKDAAQLAKIAEKEEKLAEQKKKLIAKKRSLQAKEQHEKKRKTDAVKIQFAEKIFDMIKEAKIGIYNIENGTRAPITVEQFLALVDDKETLIKLLE
jgi:hypothetical protein